MTRPPWSRTLLLILLAIPTGPAAGSTDGGREARALVAVAARDSSLQSVSAAQLRLAFLGVAVRSTDDTLLKPVLNRADPLLYEVFLQKIVFLSSQHYQRRLVAHVFQSGGQRPESLDRTEAVVDSLARDDDRISFMWREDAARYPELKIVGELWTGPVR